MIHIGKNVGMKNNSSKGMNGYREKNHTVTMLPLAGSVKFIHYM